MKCENLEVWKRACNVSVEIYKYLSNCKDYGFKDQVTRSSLSIASNIAEGMERTSDKDTMKFLDIARASSAELITQIYIGIEIGYIEKDSGLKWIKETEIIAKMISSLIKSIKTKKPMTNDQYLMTKDQRLTTND